MRAEYAIRTGIPVHPRTHAAMKEALGDLTREEEAILAAHRRAREFDQRRAEADAEFFRDAAARFRTKLGIR